MSSIEFAWRIQRKVWIGVALLTLGATSLAQQPKPSERISHSPRGSHRAVIKQGVKGTHCTVQDTNCTSGWSEEFCDDRGNCHETGRCCVPPPPPQADLTGIWTANDGGIYYVRQIGANNVWWAGLSTESPEGRNDFQKGLLFANVFWGRKQGNTIAGEWADVPRGQILQSGTLNIEIVQIAPGLSNIELRKLSATGGFGGSVWRRTAIGLTSCERITASSPDIICKFFRVMRNDGHRMGWVVATVRGQLVPYKDNVVVFGETLDSFVLGYGTVFTPLVDRSYLGFMCTPWWHSDEDPPDGDINFRMRIFRDKLEAQPNFWNEGWFSSPNDIRDKLDYHQSNLVHPELVMYARTAGKDNCEGNVPPLLPGWMESGANSVLLNGRPLNGQVDIGNHVGLEQNWEIRSMLRREIPAGTLVRVTGALAIDCHGWRDQCSDDDPEVQNVEIHPAYSIDVIQNWHLPRPNANLTGVWSASDVGTYYVRQVGNAVWWLGLSSDRGLTFANVFHGTFQGSAITGEWADIPLGIFGNSGNLNLIGESGSASTTLNKTSFTGGFGAQRWEKLYDVP